MNESTAVAESSSAPAVQVVELPRSGTSEYAEWRVSGELPEPKPKTEAAAPSPQAEEGEAAPPKKQQENRRRPDAERRIADLVAENKRLKADRESKPEPVREQPKPAVSAPQEPKPEDVNADGTPRFKTYEEYIKAQARWEARQEMAEHERQRSVRQQQDAMKAEVEKARSRYKDLDQVMFPALKAITEDTAVSPVVKALLNDSEVLPDLLYTIGTSQDDLATFLEMAKSNPGKAIRYLAVTENLIREELNNGTDRNDKGQFAKPEPPPAKRGPESTPEPPLEIGSRGIPTDESQRALSAIERGDPNAVRTWMRAENAKDMRRRRGA